VANVQRDPMLKYFMMIPVILAVVVRLLVPIVREAFIDQFDLADYYTLIMSYFFILMLPMLFGVIIGFMLLDEKDQGTLLALQVSPLSMSRYVMYRLSLPMLLSFLSLYIVFPIVNFYTIDFVSLTLISLVGAFWAPILGLILPTVANNKVEGFALMKGIGGLFIAPIAAWFVPLPYEYLFAIFPNYWPMKAFWVVDQGGNPLPFVLVGIVANLIVIQVILKFFNRKVFS
jgi:fluoroquinolone transport system permease protein